MAARISNQYDFDFVYMVKLWVDSTKQSSQRGGKTSLHQVTASLLATYGIEYARLPFQIAPSFLDITTSTKDLRETDRGIFFAAYSKFKENGGFRDIGEREFDAVQRDFESLVELCLEGWVACQHWDNLDKPLKFMVAFEGFLVRRSVTVTDNERSALHSITCLTPNLTHGQPCTAAMARSASLIVDMDGAIDSGATNATYSTVYSTEYS
ncbi:hypothetical protein LIA77_09134 [Sarocladium implicatum]|nr:hypothetical protein LIA77_09134 [Sarocladium implicatum]